jgi:hypothetical protein
MELQDFIAEQIAARPVEATIVRKVIRALKAAGDPVVKVNDGYDEVETSTEKGILSEVFNLDEATLITHDGSFVFLTMGEGYDLICDHSVNLEDALKPVSEWIEKHES